MMLRGFSLGLLVVLQGCLTLHEYAEVYFYRNNGEVACESSESFFKRMNQTTQLREVMYGSKDKAQRMARCVLLRNQLFSAALLGGIGSDASAVREAAARVEAAYQSSDDDFLVACDKEQSSKVGQAFWHIQTWFWQY